MVATIPILRNDTYQPYIAVGLSVDHLYILQLAPSPFDGRNLSDCHLLAHCGEAWQQIACARFAWSLAVSGPQVIGTLQAVHSAAAHATRLVGLTPTHHYHQPHQQSQPQQQQQQQQQKLAPVQTPVAPRGSSEPDPTLRPPGCAPFPPALPPKPALSTGIVVNGSSGMKPVRLTTLREVSILSDQGFYRWGHNARQNYIYKAQL
ncbi:unnamed protein product [Protopolystoma xenopodis]|uniref:Uncharacterized protein n=1 Tax=Protopolystoma xenopodis TaxID=117903 RepID=A0A448WDU0_9PLAT|nr:unnamed protein product [Protopolystoma xenopodis]